ncbi:hypothetical protein AB0I54_31025 [Streptomyces sp. NPDC050625]|uniref:hypothetical protein n=1 Tax=Streptomyces sp. NPDC050625 TaxID=3154629 RepID=UPI00343A3E93
MTGNHRDTSLTRCRALAVTGGTVAAGGLVAAGYQSAFADTATDAEATAAALAALDADLHARAWSPRGSAGLLAGALFLDSLPVSPRARAA